MVMPPFSVAAKAVNPGDTHFEPDSIAMNKRISCYNVVCMVLFFINKFAEYVKRHEKYFDYKIVKINLN